MRNLVTMNVRTPLLILGITVLTSQTPAFAQSQFSFAGLQWQSTIEQVEASLTKQGFSNFSTLQKLRCKVQAVCELTFSGPPIKSGSAWFSAGSLDEVHVIPQDFDKTLLALKAKYGEPIPSKDKSILAVRRLWWESSNGELLEVFSESIIYQRQGAKPQDTSKF